MTAKLYIGVFMLLAGTLYSCQKDEEVNKLDADYHVMTDYDPETDFSQFQSYYLADSVLFIGKDEKPQYLDSLQAGPILNACHHNMQERGYSRAASKENADLGLQMTYIASTYHLWDTPLHLIGGGDFPVIGVLFIGVIGDTGIIRIRSASVSAQVHC